MNPGNQQQVAQQAKLFRERGKDEVGGALGYEFQVGLRALHEAFAKQPARADGDHALDDVKTLAQRVSRGVQQGADALLLVVMQHGPAHAVGGTAAAPADHHGNTMPSSRHRNTGGTMSFQLRPAKKMHRTGPQPATSSDVPRSGCFMP
jgi:hypothetical protein